MSAGDPQPAQSERALQAECDLEQALAALATAREAIHALCLERGSTDGYNAAFAAINSALLLRSV